MSFERETRYTVLKMTDVNAALSPDECTELIRLEEKIVLCREQAAKKPLQCVVVEHDWPEYEKVWGMIEKRIVGNCENMTTRCDSKNCLECNNDSRT